LTATRRPASSTATATAARTCAARETSTAATAIAALTATAWTTIAARAAAAVATTGMTATVLPALRPGRRMRAFGARSVRGRRVGLVIGAARTAVSAAGSPAGTTAT